MSLCTAIYDDCREQVEMEGEIELWDVSSLSTALHERVTESDTERETVLSAIPLSIPSFLSPILRFVKENDRSRALWEWQVERANRDNSSHRSDFV